MALRVLDPLADEYPEHGGVRLLRGLALSAAGRDGGVQQDLGLSLADEPGNAAVLEALGRMHLRAGDASRARYFLSRYLDRVDPSGERSALDGTRALVVRLGTTQ